MKVMSYSESRANYAKVLDAVIDDQEEVIITRSGKEPVVIIPLDQYESWIETDYLLRSPANAERLRRSVRDLRQGRTVERSLIDE